MNLTASDTAILNIKSADYCCIISGHNLMQNADLTKKAEYIKTKIYYHI